MKVSSTRRRFVPIYSRVYVYNTPASERQMRKTDTREPEIINKISEARKRAREAQSEISSAPRDKLKGPAAEREERRELYSRAHFSLGAARREVSEKDDFSRRSLASHLQPARTQ